MNGGSLSGRFRLSISFRLALWYGLTLLLLLSLFALFSYVSFRARMQRDFDRHLEHEKRQILPFISSADGEPAFTSLENLRSVAYQTDGTYGTYIRLFSPEGKVIFRSPNFGNYPALPAQIPSEVGELTVSREWRGEPLRSLYSPLTGDGGMLSGWLEVSGFEWSLQRELYWMGQVLALGVLLSVLLAVAGGYMLARRTLHPVAALTAAANQIRAVDPSARLPARFGVQDELTDLANTFNGMLDRLEAVFDRERRFTANAAHELLTPLATLRSEIEVTMRRPRDAEQYELTLARMLKDVDEMSTMVRALLQLSHAERLRESDKERVDLSAISARQVDRIHRRADSKGVQIDLNAPEGALVSANAARLGEVIDNLLENAVKYTPEGGSVTVTVTTNGKDVSLSVTDTGTGFEPEEGRALFDRFYRADTPEVQAQTGSGLGLSIVQAIVEAYGGTVTASSPGHHQGSTFEIHLPRA